MSSSSEHSKIIDEFISHCKDYLERSKTFEIDKAVKNTMPPEEETEKKDPEDMMKFLYQQIFKKKSNEEEDSEEETKKPDIEILPKLFHNFIIFYFKNEIFFKERFKEFKFKWLYNKFNDWITEDFKILLDSLELLIKKLNDHDLKYDWLDLEFLQIYYDQWQSLDIEYLSTLETLILMIIKRKNRIIKDIKI